MVLRDERRTGLKVVSLSDGAVIATIPEMHFKAIMHILLMADNQTVITCGKDRTI